MLFPVFVGRITPQLRERYQRSPQWRNGVFTNALPTELSVRLRDVPGLILSMLRSSPDREPAQLLLMLPIDASTLGGLPPQATRVHWLGHSALLMEIGGLIVLLAGYILLVGPVNYHVLSRLDRREWAWATVPALTLVFTLRLVRVRPHRAVQETDGAVGVVTVSLVLMPATFGKASAKPSAPC